MRTVLASLAVCLAALLHAQCPPVTSPNPALYPSPPGIAVVTIGDFGAVQNDNCSDHDAFRAAAAWINARGGYTTLRIPNGEFIVGKQWTGSPSGECNSCFVNYNYPFKLTNCTDVLVDGGSQSVIRFEDCLKYGRFVMVGSTVHAKVNVNCANPTGSFSETAQVGAMIYLENCSKTTILDLQLHGNIDNAIIGGKYNYDGFQIWYDGLVVTSCTNITIKNVNAHHFGRDGMLLCSVNSAGMKVTIENSGFNYNGRLGMSWTGGNGLSVRDSQFNYNGVGRISSSPASGFDAEYEAYALCMGATPVFGGDFSKCEFYGNKFVGFITDQPSSATHSFLFDNCIFRTSADPYSYCSWQKSKAVRFIGCTFYGRVGPSYDASVTTWPPPGPDVRTKFIKCKFFEEDVATCYIRPPSPANCEYFPNIVEIDAIAGRVVFDTCDFTVNCNGRVWLRGKSNAGCPGCPAYANAIDMTGCKVLSKGREWCSLPAPEEPFTFNRINMNGVNTAVQAPNAVRPPGSGSYYWGPGTTYNGSFSYSTFAVPPYAPCLPLYTDPPATPAVTCGQPASVPIPYCEDETINSPPSGVVKTRIGVVPHDGVLNIVDPQHALRAEGLPYELFDAAGRTIKKGWLAPGALSIPDPGLGSGTYIIHFTQLGVFSRFVITARP